MEKDTYTQIMDTIACTNKVDRRKVINENFAPVKKKNEKKETVKDVSQDKNIKTSDVKTK